MDDDDAGWVCPPEDFGVILDIIEIEHEYIFVEGTIRCYDYKIYWAAKERLETLPDIVVEKYSDWLEKTNEK